MREPAYVVSLGLVDCPTTLFVSLIRAASQKAQLVHNASVQAIDTDAVTADELSLFCYFRKRKTTRGSTSKRETDWRNAKIIHEVN